MVDDVANLMLEQLRAIRGPVEVVSADLGDVKAGLSSVEEHLGQQLVQFGALNKRMDRFDDRLTRIERRLDLIEA